MKSAAASSTSLVVIPGRTKSLTRSRMSLAVRHAWRIFSISFAFLIGIMSSFVFNELRYIAKHNLAIAVAVGSTQDRQLFIKGCQRFGLAAELLQTGLQDAQIIVIAAHQWTIAIRAYRTVRKLRA